MLGLQTPADLEREGDRVWDLFLEMKLAALEGNLRELQNATKAHRHTIAKEFGDAGKCALEEAEKQVIAEEEIADQGHA